MGEQVLLRRPTALLHVDATDVDDEDVDPPFGRDCCPLDLPIELVYGSVHADFPVGHAPPPSSRAVVVLVQAIVWTEAKALARQHDDLRGILVYDAMVIDPLPPEPRLTYANLVETIAPAGFWVPTPASAEDLVKGILSELRADETPNALRSREQYPVQYETPDGWLPALWRFLERSVQRREQERNLPRADAEGRRKWQY